MVGLSIKTFQKKLHLSHYTQKTKRVEQISFKPTDILMRDSRFHGDEDSSPGLPGCDAV
jgi:hypothetical protein